MLSPKPLFPVLRVWDTAWGESITVAVDHLTYPSPKIRTVPLITSLGDIPYVTSLATSSLHRPQRDCSSPRITATKEKLALGHLSPEFRCAFLSFLSFPFGKCSASLTFRLPRSTCQLVGFVISFAFLRHKSSQLSWRSLPLLGSRMLAAGWHQFEWSRTLKARPKNFGDSICMYFCALVVGRGTGLPVPIVLRVSCLGAMRMGINADCGTSPTGDPAAESYMVPRGQVH